MIIDCYDSAGKKQCEIDTEDYAEEDLIELLKLQLFLNRVCRERQTEEV